MRQDTAQICAFYMYKYMRADVNIVHWRWHTRWTFTHVLKIKQSDRDILGIPRFEDLTIAFAALLALD